MKSKRDIMLKELRKHLTFRDRILLYFFKDYTYKIYIKGIKKGFNWHYWLKNYIKITLKNNKRSGKYLVIR